MLICRHMPGYGKFSQRLSWIGSLKLGVKKVGVVKFHQKRNNTTKIHAYSIQRTSACCGFSSIRGSELHPDFYPRFDLPDWKLFSEHTSRVNEVTKNWQQDRKNTAAQTKIHSTNKWSPSKTMPPCQKSLC